MKTVKQWIGYSSLLLVLSFTACNGNKEEDNKTSAENIEIKREKDITYAMAIVSATVPDTVLTGNAAFIAQNGKVKMIVTLLAPKLANKTVAVHIHEMGDCGDMGKGAHGHWNPTNQQHGKWGSSSFHAGDIGNVSLDAAGRGTLELETALWTIGGDAKTNILDHAIIVHSGTDDFTSQPAGNAGSRIGCGVIRKK